MTVQTTREVLVKPETAADRYLYMEDGFVPVACDECGAEVRVRKLSMAHTSVQWGGCAASQCAEFAARSDPGRPRALVPTCVRLRASIDRAVRDGRLTITGVSR